MRKFTKRSAALVTAGVVAVGGAGAAYAAWSLSGSGRASASAGTVVPLEVAGASTTPLVPGSTSDVKITVLNKNKFPVLIKTVVFDEFSADSKQCDDKTIKQNPAARIPANIVVPAAGSRGTDRFEFTFDDSLVMVANPPEECKLAKFSFTTKVGAESHTGAPGTPGTPGGPGTPGHPKSLLGDAEQQDS